MDPRTLPENCSWNSLLVWKGFASSDTYHSHICPINRIDNSVWCFESVGFCIAGPQWVELLVLWTSGAHTSSNWLSQSRWAQSSAQNIYEFWVLLCFGHIQWDWTSLGKPQGHLDMVQIWTPKHIWRILESHHTSPSRSTWVPQGSTGPIWAMPTSSCFSWVGASD